MLDDDIAQRYLGARAPHAGTWTGLAAEGKHRHCLPRLDKPGQGWWQPIVGHIEAANPLRRRLIREARFAHHGTIVKPVQLRHARRLENMVGKNVWSRRRVSFDPAERRKVTGLHNHAARIFDLLKAGRFHLLPQGLDAAQLRIDGVEPEHGVPIDGLEAVAHFGVSERMPNVESLELLAEFELEIGVAIMFIALLQTQATVTIEWLKYGGAFKQP